ncbi:FHA domain-containing protein, partial [bacterium]|nr:FHA domain-containing protein [bacterium]
MSSTLVLESVGDERVEKVATLTDNNVVIGRDPDPAALAGHGGGELPEPVALQFGAISREHGQFVRARAHWFYRDLGSTNGSWLNGDSLPAHAWRIVRTNDYLQLADRAVRLRVVDSSAAGTVEMGFQRTGGNRSLIVFSDGRFADEFPIPEFGRALVVGGAQADIEIRGDLFENPALVVERRTNGVCAFSVETQQGTLLNGEELTKTEPLSDRDVLQVKEHVVLFSDPPVLAAGGFGSGLQGVVHDEGRGSLQSWGSDSSDPDLVTTPREGSSESGLWSTTSGASPGGAVFSAEGSGGGGPLREEGSGTQEFVNPLGSSSKRPTLSSQFGRIPEESE